MALSREEARPREIHELRRYLRDFIESPGLQEEAMDLWSEIPHASVDNILWAALRQQAGDPGPLRAKVEVRARRNTEVDMSGLRRVLDEEIPAGLGHSLAVERVLAAVLEVVSGPVN